MRILLTGALFWAGAISCLVAQWALLRSVTSTRSAAPEASDDRASSRSAIELLWAVLPAVALCIVLALTWRAIFAGR